MENGPAPAPGVPELLDLRSEPEEVYQARRKLSEIDRQVARSKDAARSRMMTAVCAALIASDSLGLWSGSMEVLRSGPEVSSASLCAAKTSVNGSWKVGREPWRWRGLEPFQVEIIRVGSRGLLIAPCGSGKTLASWNWVAEQLDRTPKRWVLFLYPTRATANEGFRDYGANAPPALSTLLHGTSRYELQRCSKLRKRARLTRLKRGFRM